MDVTVINETSESIRNVAIKLESETQEIGELRPGSSQRVHFAKYSGSDAVFTTTAKPESGAQLRMEAGYITRDLWLDNYIYFLPAEAPQRVKIEFSYEPLKRGATQPAAETHPASAPESSRPNGVMLEEGNQASPDRDEV